MTRGWNGGPVMLTILGQPVSMKNNYVLVKSVKHGRTFMLPNDKVKKYQRAFNKQVPVLSPLISCEVSVTMRIFYASRQPDLNEDQILDLLQKRVYENDRQIWEKHIFKALDRENPRAEIIVAPIELPLFKEVGEQIAN